MGFLKPEIIALIVCGLEQITSARPCNVILDADGDLNIHDTLYGCSDNLTDPRIPYSVKNTSFENIVYTQLKVNNFYDLNAVDGTVTIDFTFRMHWHDPRWDIPEMWQYLSTIEFEQGLVIEQYIRPQDRYPLHLWIPDVIIRDAIQITDLASTFKIRPGGELYQAEHKQYTVGQPHFGYAQYPLDYQDLTLVFESYSYDETTVNLTYEEPPVLYSQWGDDYDINFAANLQWTHAEGDWKATQERVKTYYGDGDSYKAVQKQFISFRVYRESDGVILRFLLPLFIMMLLAAMIFWADPASRVTTTMGLLGSATAMFIVIFNNIPLVGYLTILDNYILVMYGCLLFCISLHHFGDIMRKKSDKYPQRQLLIRFLEAIGRTFMIGAVIISFVAIFGSDNRRIIVYVLVSILTIVIFWRELGGLRKMWRIVMKSVMTKKVQLLTEADSEPLTWAEVNLYKYFAQNHVFDAEKKRTTEVKDKIRESIELIDRATRIRKSLQPSATKAFTDTADSLNSDQNMFIASETRRSSACEDL